MKPGDLVRVYFDGRGTGDWQLTGLVITATIDQNSYVHRDNDSRWVTAVMLAEEKIQNVNLYWDDEFEILSACSA
jgi:hypothetical protein